MARFEHNDMRITMRLVSLLLLDGSQINYNFILPDLIRPSVEAQFSSPRE
jgi:hypothetical protein